MVLKQLYAQFLKIESTSYKLTGVPHWVSAIYFLQYLP